MTGAREADGYASLSQEDRELVERLLRHFRSVPYNAMRESCLKAADRIAALSAALAEAEQREKECSSALSEMAEEMQDICHAHGALGGVKRTTFVAKTLNEYRARAEAAESSLRTVTAERDRLREVPSDQEIRLHLGEMTAQEMRSIKAYAAWRAFLAEHSNG